MFMIVIIDLYKGYYNVYCFYKIRSMNLLYILCYFGTFLYLANIKANIKLSNGYRTYFHYKN